MSMNIIFKVLFWAVEMHPIVMQEIVQVSTNQDRQQTSKIVLESNIITDLIGWVHGYLLKTSAKEMWRDKTGRQ